MIRMILSLQAWEGRAYDYCMDNLRNMGFPVDGLAFDPDLVCCVLVLYNVVHSLTVSCYLVLAGHQRVSYR